MNIGIIQFHPESANGQFEIVAKYNDPLKACDEAFLIKYAIGSFIIEFPAKSCIF